MTGASFSVGSMAVPNVIGLQFLTISGFESDVNRNANDNENAARVTFSSPAMTMVFMPCLGMGWVV